MGWTREWRSRVEKGVRRVEHWMRGWRAKVGRCLRRVEHCRVGGALDEGVES